jgi:predicted metal-dependent TIM-barrel fold hydrolase
VRIFDAHVRSDTRSDEDLKNLRYFETRGMLTTAHAYRAFERAEDLLEYFEWLRTKEVERIEEAEMFAGAAIGVLPDARPRRSHPEVWAALPERLEQPGVLALGEVGAWEDSREHWELYERQLEMAGAIDKPVISTPPDDLKVNMTYKMMMRAERLDVAPSTMLMNHLDERMVETVVRDGFVAGVAVGTTNMPPREAAEAILETVEAVGHAERIVLNSALRAGSSDVLGIPKTASALADLGMDDETIEQIAFGNAVEWLGIAERFG